MLLFWEIVLTSDYQCGDQLMGASTFGGRSLSWDADGGGHSLSWNADGSS